jgi:hypothetical protein
MHILRLCIDGALGGAGSAPSIVRCLLFCRLSRCLSLFCRPLSGLFLGPLCLQTRGLHGRATNGARILLRVIRVRHLAFCVLALLRGLCDGWRPYLDRRHGGSSNPWIRGGSSAPDAWIAPRGVPQQLSTSQATQAHPPKRVSYSSQASGRRAQPTQPRLMPCDGVPRRTVNARRGCCEQGHPRRQDAPKRVLLSLEGSR